MTAKLRSPSGDCRRLFPKIKKAFEKVFGFEEEDEPESKRSDLGGRNLRRDSFGLGSQPARVWFSFVMVGSSSVRV